MTTPPLGPAGALRIAYELIDAQAAHIKALERGHWSRETRAAVEDKREELEAAQKAEELGSCCAAGACEPCEMNTGPLPTISNGETLTIVHADGEDMKWSTHRCITDPQAGADRPAKWATSPYTKEAAAHDPVLDNLRFHHKRPDQETYESRLLDIQLRRAKAPAEHTLNLHPKDAWPAKDACPRCDYLQPLWDEEQRLRAQGVNGDHHTGGHMPGDTGPQL